MYEGDRYKYIPVGTAPMINATMRVDHQRMALRYQPKMKAGRPRKTMCPKAMGNPIATDRIAQKMMFVIANSDAVNDDTCRSTPNLYDRIVI